MPNKSAPTINRDLVIRLQRGEPLGEFTLAEIIPLQFTPAIEGFCRGIGGEKPFLVTRQIRDSSDRRHSSAQVARHIEEFGGSAVQGWAIRVMPGIWISATFHVIWMSEDGKIFDIAASDSLDGRTLFMRPADQAASVDNGGLNNRYERTMVGDDELECSTAFIEQLSPIDRHRYEAFARENGLSVGQVVRTSMKMCGATGRRVDALLKERGALDAMTTISSEGWTTLREPERATEHASRKAAAKRMEDDIKKRAKNMMYSEAARRALLK